MNPPARSSAASLGRGLLCAAALLCGFAATTWALGRLPSAPGASLLSDKMRYFQAHYADSDVIFVGSSRVRRQINPVLFDEVCAAAGRPVRSFNFGQDATWPPESFYVLRQILAMPLPRLKWVFIEVMNIDSELRGVAEDTEQMMQWHDRRHTNLAERELLSLPRSLSQKLPLLWRHERLWLERASHYGAGVPWLKVALWNDHDTGAEPKWGAEAGYRPGFKRELTGALRTEFLRGLEEARAQFARTPAPMPVNLRAELALIVHELRQRGIEPLFFIAPSVSPVLTYTAAPEGARLFSFGNPETCPELYQPDVYCDPAHLNPRGAAIYTRLLAEKFIELRAGAH